MVILNGKERVSKIDTYLNCAEFFAYRGVLALRENTVQLLSKMM